jgi:hypothetical protein
MHSAAFCYTHSVQYVRSCVGRPVSCGCAFAESLQRSTVCLQQLQACCCVAFGEHMKLLQVLSQDLKLL